MPDNKIAIIKTGGKQYKVSKGTKLKVEKLEIKEGENFKFDTLLVSSNDGKDIEIGKPYLKDKIEAKIIGQGRNKKISVIKYKNKTRYKRNIGHKQPFTEIEVIKV